MQRGPRLPRQIDDRVVDRPVHPVRAHVHEMFAMGYLMDPSADTIPSFEDRDLKAIF